MKKLTATSTLLALLLPACGGAPFNAGSITSTRDGGGDDSAEPGDTGAATEAETEAEAEADASPEAAPEASTDTGPEAAPADAGAPDTSIEAGRVCALDLSGVGSRDFRISFTLTTSNGGATLDLVNQRTGCDMTSTFWYVTLSPVGGIEFATDDGSATSYAVVEAGNSVNDGQPHAIEVGRTAGKIWYASDGTIHSALVPDAYTFAAFPALSVGASTCTGTTPLAGHGTLTDLCVSVP